MEYVPQDRPPEVAVKAFLGRFVLQSSSQPAIYALSFLKRLLHPYRHPVIDLQEMCIVGDT